jgi:hypothetical protein
MLRWRKRLGDTVEAIKASGGPDTKALSKRAKLSGGYVHAVLKQGRTPSIDNFVKIAKVCGVEPCWLLFGDHCFRMQFPVIGRARQKESWRPANRDNARKVICAAGPAAVDIVAIEVFGDSNAPAYRNQDILFCKRHAGPDLQRVILGRDCVLRTQTGEYFIKQVLKGQKPGTFTLRSVSHPVVKDLKNIAVEWAAPIVWIKRGRS